MEPNEGMTIEQAKAAIEAALVAANLADLPKVVRLLLMQAALVKAGLLSEVNYAGLHGDAALRQAEADAKVAMVDALLAVGIGVD